MINIEDARNGLGAENLKITVSNLAPSNMTISITLAESTVDYTAVARFWYQICCVLRGVLRDPLKQVGDLFIARRDGAFLGMVLSTYAKHNPLADYVDFYELERLPDSLATVAINKLHALGRSFI